MGAEKMTLETVRSKIEMYLRQKGFAYEVKPNGDYGVRHGSTMVLIVPRQLGDRTFVKLVAPVALNISKITPELTRFLAEKNAELLYGKFSLDTKQKAVLYEHALLGDFLDPDELLVGVATIVKTADDFDEQISQMAGGKRAIDL